MPQLGRFGTIGVLEMVMGETVAYNKKSKKDKVSEGVFSSFPPSPTLEGGPYILYDIVGIQSAGWAFNERVGALP